MKLRPINVLIGVNGSGKSNFLDVFALLRTARDGRLKQFVAQCGGASRILHFGSKRTQELQILIHFDHPAWEFGLTLQPTATDGLHVVAESVSADAFLFHQKQLDSHPVPVGEAHISTWYGDESSNVYDPLTSVLIYHFEDTGLSSPMKTSTDFDDNRFLRPDGGNLAAFLYFLREKHLGEYRMIVRTIRQVAPFFDDFILAPMNLNPKLIKLEWLNVNSDAYFDASSLSDGTLRFIAPHLINYGYSKVSAVMFGQ